MQKFLLPFLLVLSLQTFSQKYTTTDKRAINMYERSGVYLNQRLYNTAVKELIAAIGQDPGFLEARMRLGDIYHKELNEQEKAREQYMEVLKRNPEFAKQTYFSLGEVEIAMGNYKDAKPYFEKYLTYEIPSENKRRLTQRYIANCDFGMYAIQHPVPYDPVNLGPGINSEFPEYLPTVTADDETMIFTRKGKMGEDFFISKKDSNTWQKATGLSDNINTPGNEGAQCVSPDGQYLFFAGCERPEGMGRCDIYYCKKDGTNWGKPVNLGSPINSSSWESQPSLSADGKTLYFASDRKGSLGKIDLWVSTFKNGAWSIPSNMGPLINTPEDEQSPFIHPDNKTLYYSSEGLPGMGEKDIYYTRKKEDGSWERPVNIGYPINTHKEESSLIISADGSKAYFASNSLKGVGSYDLYSFELYKEARPTMVTYVKGTVYDKASLAKLSAKIEVVSLDNNEIIFESYSNSETGEFLASLPVGKKYAFNASKEGYLFYSDHFSLINETNAKPFLLNIPLQKISVGEKMVLKNIFFETASYSLKPESKAELAKLVGFLNANEKVTIEVSGHTDNVGDEKYNLTLSENRSKAVYDFLVKAGISAARLKYKGYGKSQPTDTNATEAGRANNRRTEFRILSN